ncbi:MarR family transcriptional regulator, partial [Streptomyces sp. YS-3]
MSLLAPLGALSARMQQLLVEGDTQGAYAGASLGGGARSAAADHGWAMTRAVAVGAVRAGWS